MAGSEFLYIGDYRVRERLGSGSYSTVWKVTHRTRGTEFALKEILMEKVKNDPKLKAGLMWEMKILKTVNHPNVIRLHDIVEESGGRIHLVLEYCRGGDLFSFFQRNGKKISEVTAKQLMRQLAAGLKVLRENNIIHRDLKPQNLLLSDDGPDAVLKIADFGFARSLRPHGLAETQCGSPLYMAPEIMNNQKYDAKADLWSVGAILFQLVTGNTPFGGPSYPELVINIRTGELKFPSDHKLSPECVNLCQKLLRRNPVERLTFEEFFNHPFLSENGCSMKGVRTLSPSRQSTFNSASVKHTGDSFQDDCFPFHLDDELSGPDTSPSHILKRSNVGSMPRAFESRPREEIVRGSGVFTSTSAYSKERATPSNHDIERPSDDALRESVIPLESRSTKMSYRVSDDFDQDYVLVSSRPLDVSSSSQQPNSLGNTTSSPGASRKTGAPSSPVPISGQVVDDACAIGSLESRSSAPSGASLGSMDLGDVLEQQHPTHSPSRISSLRQCASAISEIVTEKMATDKPLEAFSIQLVILAIWKQALHICHAQAASATEGSSTYETSANLDTPDISGGDAFVGQVSTCSQIERDFLLEVERAEELAHSIGSNNAGGAEMPDAMEIIFQHALVLGRLGGVEELMTAKDSAVRLYSKAVQLLYFLLVEAPSLILNPPFSLTHTDRSRLRSYINLLNNRQDQSSSTKMSLLKSEDQTSL